MAEEAVPAAGGKAGAKPEPKPPPPEAMQDELLLKFVGTGTLVIGIVLLLSSVIAISILSILRYDIVAWLPVLPLSLLVVLVGGAVGDPGRARDRPVDRRERPREPLEGREGHHQDEEGDHRERVDARPEEPDPEVHDPEEAAGRALRGGPRGPAGAGLEGGRHDEERRAPRPRGRRGPPRGGHRGPRGGGRGE